METIIGPIRKIDHRCNGWSNGGKRIQILIKHIWKYIIGRFRRYQASNRYDIANNKSTLIVRIIGNDDSLFLEDEYFYVKYK